MLLGKRKKTDLVQFKLRLREDLRAQLEAKARTAGRSLNSEMVARLDASLGLPSMREMAAQLESVVGALTGVVRRAEAAGAIKKHQKSSGEADDRSGETVGAPKSKVRGL